jgi:hypothetical protein
MRYTSVVDAMNITQEQAKQREKARVDLFLTLYA